MHGLDTINVNCKFAFSIIHLYTRVYIFKTIIRLTNTVIWTYYNMSVSQPLLIMLVYNAVNMRHKSVGNITPELR